jgi:acetyl esterase/lipase
LWQGYAIASINYRLVGTALWPAQIEDCKAAIRWLKAHAREYGYNANRLGVVGESAGGHLAAMLGTTSGTRTFDVGENLDYTSEVACVVNLFGLSDVTREPSVAARLLGSAGKDNLELVRGASPVTYVHRDEPPMLIVHGTNDNWFLMNRRNFWRTQWTRLTHNIISTQWLAEVTIPISVSI